MAGRTGSAGTGSLVVVVTVTALLAGLIGGCGGAPERDDRTDSRAGSRADTRAVVPARPGVSAAVAGSGGSPVERLFGVGDAQQVVAVVADAAGDSRATLSAYELDGRQWVQKFGPWEADVGAGGFAPPGEKREGDRRTPSGAFGFDFAFGVLADPGVRLAYRRVTSAAIVWDDDPTSPRYNEWVDTSTAAAGVDPEPMYNPPAYDYGAVIAYNTERTPGLGSAIFLHVTKGGPTAGCVAVTKDRLVDLLRWLDPARTPRIVMGTRAVLEP